MQRDRPHTQHWSHARPTAFALPLLLRILPLATSYLSLPCERALISRGHACSAKVLEIINRIPKIDSFSDKGQMLAAISGDIQVKDVVFAYPTAPDHLVCKSYSLAIPAGQTVALCGPSGSGKSTIIQLLERFYDPLSGTITLDGVDLKALNVRWLRSQLGLVGQEPVLFQGTVATNIAYGKPGEATQAEVEEAARMANAHTFITDNLANGYLTDVGLKGGKLSGGQKQRVAIARAIIKKPAVLLLDEATSALDNESERIVQAALDEIMTKLKRTTVVIAHRLSTIRNADKIAVLTAGAVVEEGTYDALMAMGEGVFRGLAEKQEALLAVDKAAVAGAEGDGAKAPAQADPDAPVAAAANVDGHVEVEQGKVKRAKEESAPIGRIIKMQKDHYPSLLLLVGFSSGGCALVTYSFYLMVRVQSLVLGGEPSIMRQDAVVFSASLGIYAAAIIGCFSASGFFNGVAGSALTAKLRSQGVGALMRQEMGFFDQVSDTSRAPSPLPRLGGAA